MRATPWKFLGLLAATITLSPLAVQPGFAQASPYRGLWIGSISLDSVNEVPVPLDAANIPIAPDPEVPTPAFDRADLRLIIHVNGAGQAFLLKDVAILNRVYGQITNNAAVMAGPDDLSLVTDPRLYPVFPPQPAMRYASAAFDFGDAAATDALDALVEEAASQTAALTLTSTADLSTQGGRVQLRNDIVAAVQPDLVTIVEQADVAEAFGQFIQTFNSAALSAIIADTSDPVVSNLLTAATDLRDQSFYQDSRAIDMVNAVVAAVNDADPTNRFTAAHHTASSFADTGNLYQRFIAGGTFGDMIVAAASEAATLAQDVGATTESVALLLRSLDASVAALNAALLAKVPMYTDNRSVAAVDTVLLAIAEAAVDHASEPAGDIADLAEQAGRIALSDMIARYPLPTQTPTLDYTAFATSPALAAAPALAIAAAADAAISERAFNVLYTTNSVYAAAKIAAINALSAAYREAARVMRTELPLEGDFAPGAGDNRPVASLPQPSDLGAPGLTGRVYLPANHPTNPFRHRRHPDHTRGFDIERLIRIDFDGLSGDPLEAAGYGVERIRGIYREEVFGLHKPLGPDPVNQPIGIRTEGRFELNRISLIDSLNSF